MIEPGEIYLADIPPGQQHRIVIVSREDLNRGKYVVAALITSQKFSFRSKLANCVPLKAGHSASARTALCKGKAPDRSVSLGST
jgi:mRNA-degrading endonuclease toxin of MazEF toxin-antitoxin module